MYKDFMEVIFTNWGKFNRARLSIRSVVRHDIAIVYRRARSPIVFIDAGDDNAYEALKDAVYPRFELVPCALDAYPKNITVDPAVYYLKTLPVEDPPGLTKEQGEYYDG